MKYSAFMDAELGVYGVALLGLIPVGPIIRQENSEPYSIVVGFKIALKSMDVLDEVVTTDVLCALISKRVLFSGVEEFPESCLVLELYRDFDVVRLEA